MNPSQSLPPFHLGDRLRKARESAGYYNAVDFAPLVDISRDTLRKYERNETRPRRHVLVAWADVCGITYDALVGSDDGGGTVVAMPDRAPSGMGIHSPVWFAKAS
jgi:transcriptional regulator with XRE-family HTH domain